MPSWPARPWQLAAVASSPGVCRAAFESGSIERTTLIEFPSAEAAVATYRSPAYREALAVLGDGAERDVRIIEAAAEAT